MNQIQSKTTITPATRTQAVNEYYFSVKGAEIKALNEQGPAVINLGIGNPDMPPHESVIEALQHSAAEPRNHGYQSYAGTDKLRKSFVNWYARYFNVNLDHRSEVLPLMGSKEGISHISMAFLDLGDEVLIPNPGYPTYASATKLAGGIPRPYNLDADNDWQPDWEQIEAMDLSRVKIIWLNYPHMPTGSKVAAATFQRFLQLGNEHGILVCNDNPYSFILNNDHQSLLSFPEAENVALELNSLSKSHNMAGWRIGMVAGNKTLLKEVQKVKSNMDSGMLLPIQEAACKALELGDDWYQQLNETYANRRQAAEKILRLLRCSWSASQTGLFLWAKIPAHYETGEILSDELLQQARVFITPGMVFGSAGHRYIRLSLCADETVYEQAYQRIRQYLESKAHHPNRLQTNNAPDTTSKIKVA